MRFFNTHFRRVLALLPLIVLFVGANDLQAQFEFKWLNIGELHSPYADAGAVHENAGIGDNPALRYPAIDRASGNSRAYALWAGAKNFTDETGRNFAYKVSHVGPRGTGALQYFATDFSMTGRFLTEVFVDKALSFQRSVVLDEVDPNLPSERMISATFNNRLGLEFEQKAHAFSQEYHDNYHIVEYTVTNTGNVDNDPEAELSADLEGVYIFYLSRITLHNGTSWVQDAGQAWGKFTMNDAVGDGHEDYGVDFRAQYAWMGFMPPRANWNTIGGPMMEAAGNTAWGAADDTTGRLAAAQMAGRVYIHGDTSPADPTDDPGQPSMMGALGQDDVRLVEDEFDDDLMRQQYTELFESGRQYPHQADIVQPDGDLLYGTNVPNYNGDEGGFGMIEAFGPYDIPFGASIHFVVGEGVAGLNNDARLEIGTQYKANIRASLPETTPIEYGGLSMSKNEWVFTSKDSLFLTFERAIANYKSGFNIPDPPLPPAIFDIKSGPDKIALSWEMFPGASDPGGFEIWRAQKRFDDPNGYTKVADLPGSARNWDDTSAIRGIEHYYYIQSVAASANTDGTGMTPTGVVLKSNRHHTQSFLPAILTRPAGASLNAVRVVPNPYSLSQDENLRWPDQRDKIAFLDVPGNCTIRIFDQLGNSIKNIEHTDGSGDEFWNLTTESNQVIVSGIYIAIIKDLDNGKEIIRKFVVLR